MPLQFPAVISLCHKASSLAYGTAGTYWEISSSQKCFATLDLLWILSVVLVANTNVPITLTAYAPKNI